MGASSGNNRLPEVGAEDTEQVQLNVGKAYIGKLSNRETWAGAAPTPDGGSNFPVTLWGQRDYKPVASRYFDKS